MPPAGSRWAVAAFAALVGGIAVALALGALWEPIIRDSWGHVAARVNHNLGPAELLHSAWRRYLSGNPRIGQLFTTIMYSGEAIHVIVTPLVSIAALLAVAALVLGRWPSPRSPEHVAVLAIVAGMVLVAAPAPVAAAMFGYRPWTGNYVFGFLLHCLVLLPYRFHLEAPRQRHALFAPILFALGIVAGMANEHTGPATLALLGVAMIHFRGRGERWAGWMIAGVAGLAIGFLLLLFAPGQQHRYNEMMANITVVDVVVDRGAGNLRIIGLFLLCAAALVPWWLAARLVRGARLRGLDRWIVLAFVLTGALMVFTLLASPKQGWRLFYAPLTLWIAATVIWIRQRVSQRALVRLAAASAVALAFQLGALVYVHHRVHPTSDARLAQIAAAPRGTLVLVPRLPLGRSLWFVGDDLREVTQMHKAARRFGLAGIEYADRTRPGQGPAGKGPARDQAGEGPARDQAGEGPARDQAGEGPARDQPGEGRAGEGRAGERRAGERRAGEGPAGEDPGGEEPAD